MSKALHFNTYGGNPMACTVGSTVLDVCELVVVAFRVSPSSTETP